MVPAVEGLVFVGFAMLLYFIWFLFEDGGFRERRRGRRKKDEGEGNGGIDEVGCIVRFKIQDSG